MLLLIRVLGIAALKHQIKTSLKLVRRVVMTAIMIILQDMRIQTARGLHLMKSQISLMLIRRIYQAISILKQRLRII